jgi:hypothetical protein
MALGLLRSSRRFVVASSAVALASGALGRGLSESLAQTDRGLLDLLYALEQIQVALYDAILSTFDQAQFTSQGFPAGTRDRIEAIQAADHAHLDVLERPDEAPAPPTVATHASTLSEAFDEAITVKNLAIAAYAGVIPVLGRPRLIPELLGIHSVEARQAAYLSMLVGADPFPNTIDQALAPEDVLNRIESMVQGGAQATPAATPEATGPPIVAIANDLGVAEEDIKVVSVEPHDWPDTSLGCPKPGEVYGQVITSGYLIIVEVNGKRSEYHTDQQGNVVRCP